MCPSVGKWPITLDLAVTYCIITRHACHCLSAEPVPYRCHPLPYFIRRRLIWHCCTYLVKYCTVWPAISWFVIWNFDVSTVGAIKAPIWLLGRSSCIKKRFVNRRLLCANHKQLFEHLRSAASVHNLHARPIPYIPCAPIRTCPFSLESMSYTTPVDKIVFVIAGQESQTTRWTVPVMKMWTCRVEELCSWTGDNCQTSFLGIGVVPVPTRAENQRSKPFIF